MTAPTRDANLDRLALGSNCHRCGATTDEPCRTPSGRVTAPHAARVDRAVEQYRTAGPTADEARASIAELTRTEATLVAELDRTTHARSLTRIRRELAETRASLSRAVTDLSAVLQAAAPSPVCPTDGMPVAMPCTHPGPATEQPAESVDVAEPTAHGLTAPPVGYLPTPVRPVRLALCAAGHTVGRSLTVAESYAHPGAVLVTVHELHDQFADTVAARVAVDVAAAGYVVTRSAASRRLVYVTGADPTAPRDGETAQQWAARAYGWMPDGTEHLQPARDVPALVALIHAAYGVTGGRDGFLADPGGWLGALDLVAADLDDVERDTLAAIAIETVRADELARVSDPACPDYVVCPCGNDVNTGAGFWPAGPAGLTSPEVGSGWDGATVGCLECGRLIDTAPGKATPAPGDDWTPFRSPVVGRITLPDASQPRPGE